MRPKSSGVRWRGHEGRAQAREVFGSGATEQNRLPVDEDRRRLGRFEALAW